MDLDLAAWPEGVTVRRLEEDAERPLLLRAGHHFAWGRGLTAHRRLSRAR